MPFSGEGKQPRLLPAAPASRAPLPAPKSGVAVTALPPPPAPRRARASKELAGSESSPTPAPVRGRALVKGCGAEGRVHTPWLPHPPTVPGPMLASRIKELGKPVHESQAPPPCAPPQGLPGQAVPSAAALLCTVLIKEREKLQPPQPFSPCQRAPGVGERS